MTERRAVMLVWFKERAHLTDSHLTEVSQLERQITGALERFYAQGIAEGYFKPMDTTVLRLAVFGMCFLLTKLPEHPKRPSAAVITRQLQQFANRLPGQACVRIGSHRSAVCSRERSRHGGAESVPAPPHVAERVLDGELPVSAAGPAP